MSTAKDFVVGNLKNFRLNANHITCITDALYSGLSLLQHAQHIRPTPNIGLVSNLNVVNKGDLNISEYDWQWL